MAWNDNPRRGWNQQPPQQPPQWGGRPQSRRDGWQQPPQQRGGWQGPPQYQYQQPQYDDKRYPNLDIPLGTKCRVLTSKDNIIVTIIKYGREQYEVRMPDLTVNWFYPHELEEIKD